jgi:hypothetical protein
MTMTIPHVSNRSKAGSMPRAMRTKLLAPVRWLKPQPPKGEASQALRVSIMSDQGKAKSRILGAWSDKVRQGDVPKGLHMPAAFLFSQLCRPAPIIKREGATQTYKYMVMRDVPCLFDSCASLPSLPMQRKHQPSGSLPAFKVQAKPPNAVKREADAAYEAWRAARQLDHLAALTEWRSHDLEWRR